MINYFRRDKIFSILAIAWFVIFFYSRCICTRRFQLRRIDRWRNSSAVPLHQKVRTVGQQQLRPVSHFRLYLFSRPRSPFSKLPIEPNVEVPCSPFLPFTIDVPGLIWSDESPIVVSRAWRGPNKIIYSTRRRRSRLIVKNRRRYVRHVRMSIRKRGEKKN